METLLSENEAVYNFVYEKSWSIPVLDLILVIIYYIVTLYVPILTQLSCLIFVWIRSNGGANKIKRPNLVKNKIVQYLDKSKQRRPDYISVFDPTVEYYMVDVAKYLLSYRR